MTLALCFARKFRNPNRKWRMIAAACAYAMPGMLAGNMISLVLGWPFACASLGLILGALCGASFEGYSPEN